MSEVEKVKRLAVKINDWLVVAGFIVIVVLACFALMAAVTTDTPVIDLLKVAGIALIALVFWAIGSGLWCVLSGIHYELKKLNKSV